MNSDEDDFLLGIESYDSNANFLVDSDNYPDTEFNTEHYNCQQNEAFGFDEPFDDFLPDFAGESDYEIVSESLKSSSLTAAFDFKIDLNRSIEESKEAGIQHKKKVEKRSKTEKSAVTPGLTRRGRRNDDFISFLEQFVGTKAT